MTLGLNYSFRFEVLYMNQQLRNGIDKSFESSDNVVRIWIRHYLRNTKPAKTWLIRPSMINLMTKLIAKT